MTRKDYELIAEALRDSRLIPRGGNNSPIDRATTAGAHAQYHQYCHAFADKLASDNPRFDRVKFLKACGVTGEA